MQEREGRRRIPRPGGDALRAVADLVARLHTMPDVGEASRAVADFALERLDADVAGLALRPDRMPPTRLAGDHAVLAAIDGVHGVPAEPVVVDDTRSEVRWTEWCAPARRHDLLSVALVEVARLGDRPLVLELFARSAGVFGAGHDERVSIARLAGLGVQAVDVRSHLEEALETRDVIGQAQGILMERHRLTPEMAMAYLRRTSQHSQERIRRIAAQIVRGYRQPPPD